jgi:hypothetical protein
MIRMERENEISGNRREAKGSAKKRGERGEIDGQCDQHFKRTYSIRNLVLNVPSQGPLVLRVKVDWNRGKTLGSKDGKAMGIGDFLRVLSQGETSLLLRTKL